MKTFIALYRGTTLADTELVAVSVDDSIVRDVAARLLRQEWPIGDPVITARADGTRRALELVAQEVDGG